jgi:hypothetical protein
VTFRPSPRDFSTPILEWYMASSSLFSGCIYRRDLNRRRRLLHVFPGRRLAPSVRFLGQGRVSRPFFPWSQPPRLNSTHRSGHPGPCLWAQVDPSANCKFALRQIVIREEGLFSLVLIQLIKHNAGCKASFNVFKHSNVKFHLTERRFAFFSAANVFEMH